MWIMLPEGFVSVAESPNDPNLLMVRSRHRRILQIVKGGVGRNRASGIIHTPERDYQYRIFVRKEYFSAWVAHRVKEINYPKFKPQSITADLRDLYLDLWHVIFNHYEKRKRAA